MKLELFLLGVLESKRYIFMKASDLDKMFDEGKDIIKYLNLSKAKHSEFEQRRVNVDIPVWMIHSLDKQAKKLGVPRQSIIKIWFAERLEKEKSIRF